MGLTLFIVLVRMGAIPHLHSFLLLVANFRDWCENAQRDTLTLLMDANMKLSYYKAGYKAIIKKVFSVYIYFNLLNSNILSSLPFHHQPILGFVLLGNITMIY
jgi:hypothetical protein